MSAHTKKQQKEKISKAFGNANNKGIKQIKKKTKTSFNVSKQILKPKTKQAQQK